MGYIAKIVRGFNRIEKIQIKNIADNDIQKPFYHIETRNLIKLFLKIFTNLFSYHFRIPFYNAKHRKDDDSNITFKILPGRLKFHGGQIHIVNVRNGFLYFNGQDILNAHCSCQFRLQNYTFFMLFSEYLMYPKRFG